MKVGLTDITLIVDRSGSMAMNNMAEESERGIKHFIEEQKKVPGECVLSLVLFDDKIERPYTAKPLKEVESIPLIPRGWTALLDAIGSTIKIAGGRFSAQPEDQRPERVVVVIVTDGMENHSTEYTRDQVFQLIKEQTNKWNWDFIFLAANQDAIAAGLGIGIPKNAAMTYGANAQGVSAAYGGMASVVTNARLSHTPVASVGFTEEERNKAIGKSKGSTTS